METGMATASTSADSTRFIVIEGRGAGFYALLAVLAVVMIAGLWAAHTMDVEGHHITGMSNQIVWGIPHVFAVFLIVAASGALNAASLSSALGQKIYAPYARLSALLAMALLLGGLAIITLDLGRPERLMVALTHFNMTSVFAWNVFFYTGFLGLTGLYLWTLMERRMNRLTKPVGVTLLIWRLTLTTATGLIFGVLVAREAYDTAIMAPMFIAMSLSFGSAAYMLLLLAAFDCSGRPLDDAIVVGLRRLLTVFVIIVLYFVAVFHGVKLYAAEYRGIERFLLVDGGILTWLFWAGQIVAGSLVPLGLMLWRVTAASRFWIAVACALVLMGGLAQVYVIIVGGQAYPLEMFPGKEIIESSFFDGVVAHYQPSVPEFLLAFGGIAMALLLVILSMKVLQFLPRIPSAD
jgi:Ni/Fe-hydrogenase subunit HybB-like protein